MPTALLGNGWSREARFEIEMVNGRATSPFIGLHVATSFARGMRFVLCTINFHSIRKFENDEIKKA
jgi:hypothetical protein